MSYKLFSKQYEKQNFTTFHIFNDLHKCCKKKYISNHKKKTKLKKIYIYIFFKRKKGRNYM